MWKHTSPTKPTSQKETVEKQNSFHISQDKSVRRAMASAGRKGYGEPGKEKNLQVISHLQDDTLQRHTNKKPA